MVVVELPFPLEIYLMSIYNCT